MAQETSPSSEGGTRSGPPRSGPRRDGPSGGGGSGGRYGGAPRARRPPPQGFTFFGGKKQRLHYKDRRPLCPPIHAPGKNDPPPHSGPNAQPPPHPPPPPHA